ncbi:MAG: YbaN family protein [Planctomycetota bacterium]|nr:YbaN family protein [Planctomycetota bacterium]
MTNNNWFFTTAGIISLVLAALGVLLPLLPTTPFILLAAACLSKGSQRVHDWLVHQSLWGPILTSWERDGVISVKTKITATLLIMLFSSYPLIAMDFSVYLKSAAVVSFVTILTFIWTRPSSIK